jgi:WD40 repeat protein
LGHPVVFSPDGRTVAYTAYGGGKELTVINDRELPSCFNVRNLMFSRDGGHYALAALDPSLIVKDGRLIPRGQAPLFLSPDGKRIAYCVIKSGAYHLKLDGKLSEPCKAAVRSAAFSPDGKRFAYAARPYGNRYDREVLLVDGRESKQMYGSISALTFSPDSKRLACFATLDTRRVLVVDGRVWNIGGSPRAPVFSPDSKHLAVVTGDGIALDGKQIGKPGYEYYEPLTFSRDSSHVVCIARKGGKESVCVDGVPGQSYDDVIGVLRDYNSQGAVFFDAPDKFHYFAQRDAKIYRVEERL